ncbi:MAG: aminoacyl-tRNA hydrolase [Vicinamibacterales bacterium]
MKLVVGLGNPGTRFRGTLLIIGFDVLDELARRHAASFGAAPSEALIARIRNVGSDVVLVKPLTFMNSSGRAVGELQRFFKVEVADLLIVADDVNLPMGQLRIRTGGSAGGHNGLKSIIEQLGTTSVPRLRVGVGRGDPRRDLASHVLARASGDESERLKAAAVLAADAVESTVTDGIAQAMNRFNNKFPGSDEAEDSGSPDATPGPARSNN